MPKAFSLYLDFVRFSAALLVLFFHANRIHRPGFAFTTFGHEAVIIFFVLSGYVIAFVAAEKESSLRTYGIARAARIYSVAIPAILLTAFVDYVGFQIFPEGYPAGVQA